MPDKLPEEKDGLLELIKKLWLPVAGFLGAIILVYNFYQLWLGDQETVTWFLAGGGLVVLTIVLGWVGFSKKITIHKKKTKREPRYPLNYRRIALGSLGLILIGNGIGGWLLYKNWQSQVVAAEKKVIVLVAKFDGPEDKYGLRDQIIEQLRETTKEYDDTEIIAADELVTVAHGSEYARKLGEENKADLVIWAWYKPTEDPNITIHIENLSATQSEFIGKSEIYQPQATLADLKSFEVQRKLGSETGTLISFLSGLLRYEAGDLRTALERFKQILLADDISTFIDPKKLNGNIGYIYIELGEPKESLLYLDKALEMDPNYAIAYNNRGAAYLDLSSYESAVDDFSNALRLEPKSAITYSNRGIAYDNLHRFAEAINDYSQAIELDPSLAEPFNGRGMAYVSLEKYDLAINDFNRAVELRPDYANAIVNRGVVYSHLGEYNKAISEYNLAIEIVPQFSEAYFHRGYAYNLLDQYGLAIQDFNQAIKINSKFASAYNSRGFAYYNLGQYDAAISDCNQAIQLEPGLANAYYGCGLIYQKLGRTSEAETYFKKYKELTGQDAP